jgi:hypothetical protein
LELKGAEILAVGTWNGTTFTKDDLDAIVSSFNALGLSGRIPLKIGHDADHMADNAPALGWVDNLRREGNTLVADFKSIPSKLYDAIKEGLYKFVSVELLGNVKASTRVLPWVLDAVAILGATPPAVGILKDLQSLTLARKAALRFGSRVVLRRNFTNSPTEVTQMDEAQVQALIKAQVEAVKVSLSAEVTELKTKLSASEDRARAAEADAAKAKVAAHIAAISGKFEAAINADTLDPAKREQFKKLSKFEDEKFALSVDLKTVDEYIKDNAKKPSKKALSRDAGDDAADEAGIEWAADLVAHRVNKLMLSRNIPSTNWEKRIELADEVLRKDKDLADAYRDHAKVPTEAA